MSKVTVREAALLTGKSRETINAATKDGTISYTHNEKNHKVIDISELLPGSEFSHAGLGNAIPDGDDLLHVGVRTHPHPDVLAHQDPTGECGIMRWHRVNGKWCAADLGSENQEQGFHSNRPVSQFTAVV